MASSDDAYNQASNDSQSQFNSFPEITEFEQLAAVGREIFETYLSQGFSEAQSLYIVSSLANGNPGFAPKN